MSAPLLDIEGLRVEYRSAGGALVAIPDLSLTIAPGEAVGIVGESGCGKSTLLMAIMGHLGQSGRIARGHILLDGVAPNPVLLGRLAASSIFMFAAGLLVFRRLRLGFYNYL